MGRRGPAPKPTKLKEIQGTARKDRASGNEPKPEIFLPKCPTFLKGEARREWKRITPELMELKLLSRVDRAALAAYCSNWETFVITDKVLREEGLTAMTPNGHIQQRPEIAIRNKAMQLMQKFLSEFGMSPASRTRITLPDNKPLENNKFAVFTS